MAAFRILLRLLVFQFYKLNAGFFLFIFIFFFGIISPGMQIAYHLSIIHSVINSFFLLAFVITCWFLYNLKCVSFFERVIRKYRESFLCELQAINEKKLFAMVIACHLLVFLPVAIYASIVELIAWQQQKFIAAIIIVISIFLMIAASSFYIKKLLVNLTSDSKRLFLQNLYRRRFGPSYLFYSLYYILYKKKVSVFTLKVFSFALFYLVFIRSADNFDKDSFTNILILIGYFHSILLFQVHKFVEEKCSFTRNLPLPLLKRMAMFFVPVCVLYLPEIFYLCINRTTLLSFPDIIKVYLMLVSQLMLYTSIIYMSNFKLKIFLRWIFIIAFALVFLNKLMNLDLLIVVQFLFSYLIFQSRYFKYQHEVYTN